MSKRIKIIKKLNQEIKSFNKVIEFHKEKLKNYKGKDYSLIEYWKKEIRLREKERSERISKLNKILNKK